MFVLPKLRISKCFSRVVPSYYIIASFTLYRLVSCYLDYPIVYHSAYMIVPVSFPVGYPRNYLFHLACCSHVVTSYSISQCIYSDFVVFSFLSSSAHFVFCVMISFLLCLNWSPSSFVNPCFGFNSKTFVFPYCTDSTSYCSTGFLYLILYLFFYISITG